MVTLENTGERPYQVLDSGQDPRRLVVIEAGGRGDVSDGAAKAALKERPDTLKKLTAAAAKQTAGKGGAS
jgi:hypothetical protein